MDTRKLLSAILLTGALSLVLAGSLAACKGGSSGVPFDGGTLVDDGGGADSDASVPAADGEGIDILFVIDDSGSMFEEQASLVANFQRFITVLEAVEGGLPDIHIGVVSTNVGAGGFDLTGCEGNGDNGQLLSGAGVCEAPSDPYIVNVANGSGGRTTNYTGSLTETFSCIAELGIAGCGFEQPLESMRRALNGVNFRNDGFLRPEALLAVVIITDEDDCSATNGAIFDPDPALDTADSALGFLGSFRCFEFGVVCSPDDPRAPGAKSDCVARDNSPFMADVSEYAEFLKGLKANPGNIVVAGIIGNPSPVSVVSEEGRPQLGASCSSASGDADPGVRLQAFFNEFPQRNTVTTICNEDLSDALTLIADLLAVLIST